MKSSRLIGFFITLVFIALYILFLGEFFGKYQTQVGPFLITWIAIQLILILLSVWGSATVIKSLKELENGELTVADFKTKQHGFVSNSDKIPLAISIFGFINLVLSVIVAIVLGHPILAATFLIFGLAYRLLNNYTRTEYAKLIITNQGS